MSLSGLAPHRLECCTAIGSIGEVWFGRDRGTARATLGKDLAVSAFPLYVPV
jgi:hypothetical protein